MTQKLLIYNFNYKNTQKEVFISFRNQKKLILRYIKEKLVLSVPFGVSKKTIESFLIVNVMRIEKIIENKENNIKKLQINWVTKTGQFKLFDKTVFFIKLESKKIHTKIINNVIHMNYLKTKSETIKKINNFLKKYFFIDFYSVYQKCLKKFDNIDCNSIKIQNMSTKWGVCNSSTKIIKVNLNLIFYSKEILEYVIIHELVHLIYQNHSKNFWMMIKLIYPKYKYVHDFLREQYI